MKIIKSTADFEYIKLPSSEELTERRDELLMELHGNETGDWVSSKLRDKASRMIQDQHNRLLDDIAKFVIDRRPSEEITITVHHGAEYLGIGSGSVTASRFVRVNPDEIHAESLYRRELIFTVEAGYTLLCFGGSYFTAMSHGRFHRYIAGREEV